MAERSNCNLVATATERALGTGRCLVELMSELAVVLDIENVTADGTDLVIVGAGCTGGCCGDELTIGVVELLYNVVNSNSVTAGALKSAEAVGGAGSLNLSNNLIVVVTAAASHLLSLLVCYCIHREVRCKEGYGFCFLIILNVGDLGDRTVSANVPDNDTVLILGIFVTFIIYEGLECVRNGYGYRSIEVAGKRSAVDGNVEVVEVNVLESLLLLGSKVGRLLDSIVLSLIGKDICADLNVLAALELTDNVGRELDSRVLSGNLEGNVLGNSLRLNLCLLNLGSIKVGNYLLTNGALLTNPAVAGVLKVNVGVRAGSRNVLGNRVVAANGTYVNLNCALSTGGSVALIVREYVVMYVGSLVDLDFLSLAADGTLVVLRTVILTVSLGENLPLAVVVACSLRAFLVYLVYTLTNGAGVLGISGLLTACGNVCALVCGYVFLVLGESTLGTGVIVSTVEHIVVSVIVRGHGESLGSHYETASDTAICFCSGRYTGRNLSGHTLVLYVVTNRNGRALGNDGATGFTNLIARITLSGTGCRLGVSKLSVVSKGGDRCTLFNRFATFGTYLIAGISGCGAGCINFVFQLCGGVLTARGSGLGLGIINRLFEQITRGEEHAQNKSHRDDFNQG